MLGIAGVYVHDLVKEVFYQKTDNTELSENMYSSA